MDRELTSEQRRASWLHLSKWWITAVGLVLLVGAWGAQRLSPALERSELNIAVVERGPIEAVISTTGTVIPIEQQTVSSPLTAEVLKVHAAVGETVREGQPLLDLDGTAAALTLERLQEELALKREEQRSNDLQLADAVREASSRRDLLAVDLEGRNARLQRFVNLGIDGVASEQELLEARLLVKRAQIELQQVKELIVSLIERREAEKERLRLTLSILERQVADQERRLALASVTAPRSGVVTTLVSQRGASVTEGQVLATVAGQESFRVEAMLSDFYAPQLKPGQRVRVQQGSDPVMAGQLARIVPASTLSQTMLYVDLDNPSSPRLRANARVNVEVITADKSSGLRVSRGSGFKATGVQDLYVVRGDHAVRKSVRTGLSSSQKIEILDGLQAGDQVIISDMSAYQADELAIR
jgi:HlyD family secretion protein